MLALQHPAHGASLTRPAPVGRPAMGDVFPGAGHLSVNPLRLSQAAAGSLVAASPSPERIFKHLKQFPVTTLVGQRDYPSLR